MNGSNLMKLALFVGGLLYALAASGQSSVVVIPMLETETVYTGIAKTGDDRCSVYKPSPENWQEQDCVSLPAALQGQDGQLQMGAELIPRYTDNFDGTVTDALTRLVWLQNAFCAGVATGSNWSEALAYLAELNASGTMDGNDCGDTSNAGGHQENWRLPNVRELQSLLDYGSDQGPYLSSTHPFLNVQTNEAYWSSTNYGVVWDQDLGVNLLDDAYRVNFDDAVTDGTGKNGQQHVWAVRGLDTGD